MKQAKLKSVLLTLLLIFIFLSKGYSIGNETPVGAREMAMGNGSVALISPFAVFNNQSALAYLTKLSIAVDYRQPYLIDDLSERALALVIPLSPATFAIGIEQIGIQNYHESRFGLAMAKKFGDKFSAGLQFNYFMIDFPEQGESRGTLLIEFGIFYKTKDNLSIGVHIFNPAKSSIESLNMRSEYPFHANSGIALKPSDHLILTGEVGYYADLPVNISMGGEYQFSDRFFLRCGVSGKPIRHSIGLGYRCNLFGIDFAMIHHQKLGYTPSISLILKI